MKSTSIKAYKEEVENGHITRKARQVLAALKAMGKATARQLGDKVPGAWRRMSELYCKGLVEAHCTTKCEYTGKIVTLYYPTDNQPLLCPPPKPRKPTRVNREAEIVRLTKELDRRVERAAQLYDVAYRRGYQDCANGIKFNGEE